MPSPHRRPFAVGLAAGLLVLVAAIVLAASSVEPAVAGPNQCRDEVDNDGDALIDQKDPGCLGPRDFGEADGRQLDEPPATPTPSATPTQTATPTPEPPPTPAPKAQCADGRDNDKDGKVDAKDPGCASSSDNDERDAPAPAPAPKPQCSDGVDNDKDGKIDAGQDPGCSTSSDNDETDPPPAAASPPAGQAFGFTGTPPVQAKGLLSPFPVVRIAGRIYRSRVRIKLLTVKAPAGSTISVRCDGRGCARSTQKLTARSGRAGRRVRRFERTLRVGAMLEIRVYKTGTIGKYTRFTVHRGRLPGRSDRCLMLNRRTPRACPKA